MSPFTAVSLSRAPQHTPMQPPHQHQHQNYVTPTVQQQQQQQKIFHHHPSAIATTTAPPHTLQYNQQISSTSAADPTVLSQIQMLSDMVWKLAAATGTAHQIQLRPPPAPTPLFGPAPTATAKPLTQLNNNTVGSENNTGNYVQERKLQMEIAEHKQKIAALERQLAQRQPPLPQHTTHYVSTYPSLPQQQQPSSSTVGLPSLHPAAATTRGHLLPSRSVTPSVPFTTVATTTQAPMMMTTQTQHYLPQQPQQEQQLYNPIGYNPGYNNPGFVRQGESSASAPNIIQNRYMKTIPFPPSKRSRSENARHQSGASPTPPPYETEDGVYYLQPPRDAHDPTKEMKPSLHDKSSLTQIAPHPRQHASNNNRTNIENGHHKSISESRSVSHHSNRTKPSNNNNNDHRSHNNNYPFSLPPLGVDARGGTQTPPPVPPTITPASIPTPRQHPPRLNSSGPAPGPVSHLHPVALRNNNNSNQRHPYHRNHHLSSGSHNRNGGHSNDAAMRMGVTPNGLTFSQRSSPAPRHPKRGPDLPRRFVCSTLTELGWTQDHIPAWVAANGGPDNFEDQEMAVAAAIRALERCDTNARLLVTERDLLPPTTMTHLVIPRPQNPASLKGLAALATGKWLVPPEYVFESAQMGFWLDESSFPGVVRCNPRPFAGHDVLLTIKEADLCEKLKDIMEAGGAMVVAPQLGDKRQRLSTVHLIIDSAAEMLDHCRDFAECNPLCEQEEKN